jgi:hypothetical protein
MPLESIHKLAFKAAEAARCAGEQGKYWEMHDRLFENQKALEPWRAHAEAVGLSVAAFEDCVGSGKHAAGIRRDMGEARKVGVTGTPAFMLAKTEPGSSTVRVLAALSGAKAFGDFKAEIDRLLEQIETGTLVEPAATTAAAAPAVRRTASAVQVKTLEADRVAAMQDVLTRAPEGSPAWIVAPKSDPAAVARAEDLARVFTSSGWKVGPVNRSAVRVKPGMFLFVGDESPPAYVDSVRQALESAGLTPSVATGYRAFYAERLKSQPAYQGFPFADGQTFVLVVGRATP